MLLEGHNLAFGLCPKPLDQFCQIIHRLVVGGFIPFQVSHCDIYRTMAEQMGDGAQSGQLGPLRSGIMPKAVWTLFLDLRFATKPEQAIPIYRPLVGLAFAVEEDDF